MLNLEESPPKRIIILDESDTTFESDAASYVDTGDTTWRPENTLDTSYQESDISDEIHEEDTNEEVQQENEVQDIKMMFADVEQVKILLKYCNKCKEENNIEITRRGAHVTFHCRCPNGHRLDWHNVPYSKGQPVLNILLAATILCSGIAFASFKRFVDCTGLAAISKSTYERKVEKHASPIIQNEWITMKKNLLQKFKADSAKMIVCGDARFDSPGKFSAKYCIYTLMSVCGNIVDFVIYQKGLMPGEMEAKSFKFVFSRLLEDFGRDKISIFCSDRNMSVAKIMRISFAGINHAFDVIYFTIIFNYFCNNSFLRFGILLRA